MDIVNEISQSPRVGSIVPIVLKQVLGGHMQCTSADYTKVNNRFGCFLCCFEIAK